MAQTSKHAVNGEKSRKTGHAKEEGKEESKKIVLDIGNAAEYTKSELCQLPELGLSCIGCCGGYLKDKEKILEDIKSNTKEVENYPDYADFIKRAKPEDLRESGICRNMTFIGFHQKTGNLLIGCPAHPEFNSKTEDDRKGHCDIGHLCKAASLFNQWSEETRKDFMNFLKYKVEKGGMDWFEYSIKMDNNELLDEFYNHVRGKTRKRGLLGRFLPQQPRRNENINIGNIK